MTDLLRNARTAGDLRAALEALPNDPRLREALVECYDALAAGPKRDPAASLRAELLRALRPLVTVADRERLEKALVTYEFGPLGENCSGLRAAALLALGDLDPDLAELYAVHLLGDGHTEHMSGEPALTAVQFLVRRGALATVYLHALRAGEAQEDRAEALRNLASLPAPLVLELADEVAKTGSVSALVGLFDLLTAHDRPEAFAGFVKEWALHTEELDLMDFALAQAVAQHREPLVDVLKEARRLRGLDRFSDN